MGTLHTVHSIARSNDVIAISMWLMVFSLSKSLDRIPSKESMKRLSANSKRCAVSLFDWESGLTETTNQNLYFYFLNDDQIQNRFEAVTERNRNLAREKKQMRQQKDEANAFHALKKETVWCPLPLISLSFDVVCNALVHLIVIGLFRVI